ncbi:MAG: hypothetical protein GY774_04605 [Planctomycetes bacterium]|nr:hypothetical protein [Planctomycetota bacterium]
MSWTFILDNAFFAILGLLTFPILVLFVSSVSGWKYEDARKTVTDFLANWGQLASGKFINSLLNVAGVSSTLLLLSFLAYTANRTGDALVPKTGRIFFYFGSEEVRWSAEWKGEWKDVKWDLRDAAGIGSNRVRWEEAKGEMGKYDVRLFRTATVLLLGVAVGAIVGLIRKTRRHREAVILGFALLSIILMHWLWVERQEKYIENVVSRYTDEYMQSHEGDPPDKPKNYPGWWPSPPN